MQFLEEKNRNLRITSFKPGDLIIGERHYHHSVIIDSSACALWDIQRADQINLETLQPVFAKAPDVIIIGTGERLVFPPQEGHLSLMQKGTGIEFMDSAAASRTFNVLASEGRKVVAAIFV